MFQEAKWYAACCSSTKGQSLGVAWLAEKLGLISVITVQRGRSVPFFQEQTLLEACLPTYLWNKKISCLQQITALVKFNKIEFSHYFEASVCEMVGVFLILCLKNYVVFFNELQDGIVYAKLMLEVFRPFLLVLHSAELSGLNKMPLLNSNRRRICHVQVNFSSFFLREKELGY